MAEREENREELFVTEPGLSTDELLRQRVKRAKTYFEGEGFQASDLVIDFVIAVIGPETDEDKAAAREYAEDAGVEALEAVFAGKSEFVWGATSESGGYMETTDTIRMLVSPLIGLLYFEPDSGDYRNILTYWEPTDDPEKFKEALSEAEGTAWSEVGEYADMWSSQDGDDEDSEEDEDEEEWYSFNVDKVFESAWPDVVQALKDSIWPTANLEAWREYLEPEPPN